MLGLKGYSCSDTVTKPNDTALATSANWTRITDLGLKDTAGVVVTTL